MASLAPYLPPMDRDHGKVPGGFDDDEEPHPTTAIEADSASNHDQSYSSLLPDLPQSEDSLLHNPSNDGDVSRTEGDTDGLNEREMRRKLMDIESSFIPAQSPPLRHEGDTFDFEAIKGGMGPPPHPRLYKVDQQSASRGRSPLRQESELPQSPPTPPESYRTPAPPNDIPLPNLSSAEGMSQEQQTNTSSLETMSSSPAAAAAARSISRAVSMATLGGYETANDRSPERSPTRSDRQVSMESAPDAQDHGDEESQRLSLQPSHDDLSRDTRDAGRTPGQPRKRPSFLRNRHASQRSSASSFNGISTNSRDGASDVTVAGEGAGGTNAYTNSMTKQRSDLSRSTSLGSIASGITGIDDYGSMWDRRRVTSSNSLLTSNVSERGLTSLDEENQRSTSTENPETPRATSRNLTAPTDTVIAQHIKNINVPDSVAREYKRNNRPVSPEKRAGMPTPMLGRSKGLTLKEQSSTIDRLQKENFDLKLKIHYLNQALNERSEEGVKEMISENVELKAALATMEKNSRTLRKTIRDLEQKLKEKEEEGVQNARDADDERDSMRTPDIDPDAVQDMEEEITYLRERVETYEVEFEKMRHEGLARESEKRRLAALVKAAGERRGNSDIGAREEMDMWKDLLEAETARREQADESNRALRDEIWRLKNDGSSTTTNNHTRNVYNISSKRLNGNSHSRSGESTLAEDRNGAVSAASSTLSTLVEQLRHENEELRREVGAQTSMLTSRNREKERLYQEIEDLKIGQMRGDTVRSIAGDSILERSASRAGAASRVSGNSRVTGISDAEREEYENRNGQLRDQISQLKMTNQELERQLEGCLDDLDKADATRADHLRSIKEYEDEMQIVTQDLQTMQAERNEALVLREEMEAELETFKNEANEEIAILDTDIEQKNEEIQRLSADLRNREENFVALQEEMKSMSDIVIRLEDDQQANVRKMQSLQQDLNDANRELEELEKTLREANGKIERFTVQQESSQGEIAFLREEQDGDKIKIGDLETALKQSEISLQDERERSKELDKRLSNERQQREIIGTKEKQEVQVIMNGLNREASYAKDEARKLRKALSAKEVEMIEWKERLTEFESNLREILGNVTGTRSGLLTAVTKLQSELETTVADLETTKERLSEKERVLLHRDALLENSGLESRRLVDMLEKERQTRRAEKNYYEQIQKTSLQTHRSISQQESKILELEASRASDRKQLAALETQTRDQLMERHNLLLAIWNRLSTMCGPEWAHKNTLVGGRLPSLEVISTSLPEFGKNLLNAVKTIESIIGGFRSRIRSTEKELWKGYQTLEHDLDMRSKKLDRLEGMVGHAQTLAASSDLAKLKADNKLLRAELNVLKRSDSISRARGDFRIPPGNVPVRDVSRGQVPLSRHNSTSGVELYDRSPGGSSMGSQVTLGAESSDQRWIQRLRELEKRLKAERELRLQDRTGAQLRLLEGERQVEELKKQVEREKVRQKD